MIKWLVEQDFMPHGHCYLWRPDILWMHVISDGLIALAYFSIPASLVYILRKRRDIPFRGVLALFAVFIILCGSTHVLAIITVWNPIYVLDGVVKVATAIASVLTALVLIPLLPKALAMRSPAELEAANLRLSEEVKMRTAAEQKMAKAVHTLKLSNHDLEQFAYATSHDLQSPLRGMVGFSGLLRRQLADQQDPQVVEYLRSIEEAGVQMQDQIAGLLKIARVNLETEVRVSVSMDQALLWAKQLLLSEIGEKQAEIQSDPLPEVLGNEAQMVQLLQNLIGNAIKYTAKGQQPKVMIEACNEGAYWHFIVSDNGIGIAEEHLNSVFVIFKRLHAADTYAGSGIGLALCKKIVERHDGRIWAESVPGNGTQFHFTLPAASPQPQAPSIKTPPPPAP